MTKYQRGQITLAINEQLEIITEQFIMASQNKGAIPLIEIDLLKESVRTLYQQINDWQITSDANEASSEVVEEKNNITTTPIAETPTNVNPIESLFNDANATIELEAPVMEAPTFDSKTIKNEQPIIEESIPVTAEPSSTNSESFLTRMLKNKSVEKAVESKQEVEANNVVSERPAAKPALQVSRTVYPDPDTTTGNRFKGQETIYDRLRQQNSPTVAERISAAPVVDLRKSIGINERFTLINELFNGNQQLFMESIDKINNVNAYEEARKMLYEELAGSLKWNTEGNTFHVLDELVKRRFNG